MEASDLTSVQTERDQPVYPRQ